MDRFKNKKITWNAEKNIFLQKERGICFEDVLDTISNGKGIKVLDNHFNKEKYPNQLILIIEFKNYSYYVPFVKKKDGFFFKTIIPSRKLSKIYGNNKK